MGWWKSVGLRARVMAILTALLVITLAGGAAMIWYTYRMDSLFHELVEREVSSLQAAEELEVALVKQRGLVSYYFINGDQAWLSQLDELRRDFREHLKKARELARSPEEDRILSELETGYSAYVASRDEVIALYKQGKRDEGAEIHEGVRGKFLKLQALCDEFSQFHRRSIHDSMAENEARAGRLRLIAAGAMTAAAALAGLLAFVLVSQILDPIRVLARETAVEKAPGSGDDIADLETGVRGLMDDVSETRTELAKSRERLFQSEKMAMMGKLAADVAHSIRNPMTSIKMRLFSLERGLDLSANQREDFEVVSEEMRRLDNIVRNFLEFSRPPKLKIQKTSVTELINMTLTLLRHKLESKGITVERHARSSLPEICADPEMIKEVLVNLVVNACEAMDAGGRLTVSEEEAAAEGMGRAVLIRISDTGPGVPESILDRVFEPFFSTKEDGTGLGLPIAARIVEEHGGRLEMRSEEGRGAAFLITLPVKEEECTPS